MDVDYSNCRWPKCHQETLPSNRLHMIVGSYIKYLETLFSTKFSTNIAVKRHSE